MGRVSLDVFFTPVERYASRVFYVNQFTHLKK